MASELINFFKGNVTSYNWCFKVKIWFDPFNSFCVLYLFPNNASFHISKQSNLLHQILVFLCTLKPSDNLCYPPAVYVDTIHASDVSLLKTGHVCGNKLVDILSWPFQHQNQLPCLLSEKNNNKVCQ